MRELREGMEVPHIAAAFKELDLPVTDLQQLLEHLDTRRAGEITLDEFEQGCHKMKEPASRIDMARLMASLNGRVELADGMELRCERLSTNLGNLAERLGGAFAELREHVMCPDVRDKIPEVSLRRAGRMVVMHP